MRKDYRVHNPYDLRKSIGKYHQTKYLKQYYKFYSSDDNSIRTELSNLANKNGDIAVGYNVEPSGNTPYRKRIRYTSHLYGKSDGSGNESYYKIPFGGDATRSFKNDGQKATIACWAALGDLNSYNSPGSEPTVIWNKLTAGILPGSWDAEGEMRLEYYPEDDIIKFVWAGQNTSTAPGDPAAGINFQPTCTTIKLKSLSTSPTNIGDWIHVAVVIKQPVFNFLATNPTGLDRIIEIYVNGQSAGSVWSGGDGAYYGESEAYISKYWKPNIKDGVWTFGRGKGDVDSAVQNPVYRGLSLYDFAVWNHPISEQAVSSIYNTSRYFQGTGFLSISPRAQLKELPNLSTATFNSYSTPILNKNPQIPFDDSRVQIFDDSSLKLIQYPFGLPHAGIKNNNLISSSLASPNLMPDISGSGYTNVNILEKYYLPSQVNEGAIPQSPFNDALVLPNSTESFYGSTKSISGFKSKLQDKIQITLELPVNESITATRHSAKWDSFETSGVSPHNSTINPHYGGTDGEWYQKENTGFYYYNTSRGAWEQKGLSDVLTEIIPTAATFSTKVTGNPIYGQSLKIYDATGNYDQFETRTDITTYNTRSTGQLQVGIQDVLGDNPGIAQRFADAINSVRGEFITVDASVDGATLTITQLPGVAGNAAEIIVDITAFDPNNPGASPKVYFSGGSSGYYENDEIAQEIKPTKLSYDTSQTIKGLPQVISGTSHMMRLFYPGGSYSDFGQYPGGTYSTSTTKEIDVVLSDQRLAANIGHPMVSNYGPNGVQYFATSSQRIKMSNYISEPFLLEKVILELPDTVARKKMDYSNLVDSPRAARPQDDYIFFLMRQEKRFSGQIISNADIKIEASSSLRYLICSGNACFYNKKRRVPGHGLVGSPGTWEPYNSPSFKHFWNNDLDGNLSLLRSGSINLNMSPAVPSQKVLGNYFIPAWNGTIQTYMSQSKSLAYHVVSTPVAGVSGAIEGASWTSGLAPGMVNSFWPGGNTTNPLEGSLTGSRTDVDSLSLRMAKAAEENGPAFSYLSDVKKRDVYNARTFYEVNPYKSPIETNFPARYVDSRTFKPYGGGASSVPLSQPNEESEWGAFFADNLKKTSAESPYLLLPEDELVLGLDAALGWTASQAAGITSDATDWDGNIREGVGANNITGSFLRIESGQTMKLRFFGSLVRDQKQAPHFPDPIPDPDFTTPIIGSHVLDQYDISPVLANSGSYRQRLVTGSMTNGEGPARRENLGIPVSTSAVNKKAFIWSTTAGQRRNVITTIHPDPGVTYKEGPSPYTVVTCSIPSSVTGLKKSDATSPLEKFYLRFCGGTGTDIWGSNQTVSASLGANTTGVHPGPAHDEIYLSQNIIHRSGSQFWQSYSSPSALYAIGYDSTNSTVFWSSQYATMTSLSLTFGQPDTSEMTRNLYIATGSAFSASSDLGKAPVPGFSSELVRIDGDNWPSQLKLVAEDTGGAANSTKFYVGSGSSNCGGGLESALGVGSLPWAKNSSGQFVAGYRNISGSDFGLVGGPNFHTSSLAGGLFSANPLRSVAASAANRTLGEFSSFNRFVTLIDKSEVYYDSAVPAMVDIWSCLGKEPMVSDVTELASAGAGGTEANIEVLLFGISTGKNFFGGSSGGSYPLTNAFSSNWWAAFPFEPRFSHLPGTSITTEGVSSGVKVPRVIGTKAAKDSEGRIAASFYWITDDVYPGFGQSYANNTMGMSSSSLGFQWWDLVGGQPQHGASISNAELGFNLTMNAQTFGQTPNWTELSLSSVKAFYGIGDGLANLIENSAENFIYPTGEAYNGDGINVDENGLYPTFYRLIRRAQKPRGWKYGLINAIPQKTQAVFRSDTYGQFRDMLEPRKYTVFVETPTERAANSPVIVSFNEPAFVNADPKESYPVNPEQTRSSNLSYYATSSLPYFDDLTLYPYGRERPNPILTTDLDIVFEDVDSV